MRPCAKCKVLLPLADYSLRGGGKRGYQARCKKCVQDGWKSAAGRKTTWRKRHLKTLYGLSLEQYERMVAGQDNRCAICKEQEQSIGTGGVVKRLAVDHDRETGVIRGLLCQNCNTAIGKFRHDPQLLFAAADYVNIRLRLLSA